MKNISKDLTIILILKDRAPFTWRWMEYYNMVGLPYKVIIADGGKDESVEKLKDTSLFPNLEYEYIRYPYDKDIPTFLHKFQAATSRVTTPYTLLTDNDDFFFVDGLEKAVEFLDSHPDYFSARGEICDFLVKPKSSTEKDTYGNITGFAKSYPSPSNTESTVLERVKVFSKYSDDLAHDVCRTDGLKKTCETLAQSGVADLQLSNDLMDYLLVTCGKVHRGDGLFMLHQSHVGGLGRTLVKANIFEWMLSPSWPKEFSDMCTVIATEISNGDGIPLKSAYDTVMQYYMALMIGENMIKNRLENNISQMPPRIVTLGRIFKKDNPIRLGFKKIYTSLREWRLQIKSNRAIAASPYRQKIEHISDFLLRRETLKVGEKNV